ncbi:MAG: 1-acyl-sn-glycerol-3-phosphate acyltransferase [bacterium]|nr:1-acyl-sn-glycerol-3-phosphate acyltransferase [bacterium]
MGLFYTYCKYNTRLTSHLFYENIRIGGIENIPLHKPVVLALNHPNSFLDAVIVGAVIDRPTHFLARGDAFKSNVARPILHSLNMLPVFRLSEGKENLSKNTETFDACQNILEERKVVIIFAEGLSENNWDLRSLKKGPARISIKAWSSDTPAKDIVIVPVGLTYEHYKGAGKNILVNFGKPIERQDFEGIQNEAQFVRTFNERLFGELGKLAYIAPSMKEGDAQYTNFRQTFRRLCRGEKDGIQLLSKLNAQLDQTEKRRFIPFIKSSLLFAPLYALSTWLTPKIVKQSLFFDSISFGLVMFLWPFYLLGLGLLLACLF